MLLKKIIQVSKGQFIDLYLRFRNIIGLNYVTFRLKSGELLKIRNIDQLGVELLKDSGFEKATHAIMMANISEGMTVLDIGANIGSFTIQMATKVGSKGRVIAFEPNPIVVEQLRENVQINKLENVTIEEVALSNSNDFATFAVPQLGKEAHGSFKHNPSFDVLETIIVKTERLDDALSRLNITKVDFIKMDTEGAERLIFGGAAQLLSSTFKPMIIFECAEICCSEFGHTVFDVLNDLVKCNYVVKQYDYGMWLAYAN